jgi:hypothetical protein
LAQLHFFYGKHDDSIVVLEKYMKTVKTRVPKLVNNLCDLYIGRGDFKKVISLIRESITTETPFESLEMGNRVKFGIAQGLK